MAAPTGGYVLRDAIVKFGSTVFTNQVQKVRLVPNVTRETFKTLVPDGVVNDVTTFWELELMGVQDWETGGIADYLNTNAGSVVTVVVAPRSGTGRKQATVSVMCQPVEFGGEQGSLNTFDVTLGCNGTPVFSSQP
jgi:hypothetical protein